MSLPQELLATDEKLRSTRHQKPQVIFFFLFLLLRFPFDLNYISWCKLFIFRTSFPPSSLFLSLRKTDRQAGRRHTSAQTQTDRQTGRQEDRQTDREAHTHRKCCKVYTLPVRGHAHRRRVQNPRCDSSRRKKGTAWLVCTLTQRTRCHSLGQSTTAAVRRSCL